MPDNTQSASRMTWEDAVAWLRSQPDQQDLVRACFYDDPALAVAERYYTCAEWQALREFLPTRRGTALDLGAGRGIGAYALARDGWDVTALEPDKSAIVGAQAIQKLASTAGLSIRVVEEWGESLPFEDGNFDFVYARQVLHHAKNLGELCKEVARVLRPGGLFIALREHVIDTKEDLPAFLASHPLHALYGGENAFLLEQYLDAVRKSGLQVRTVLSPLESDINLYPGTRAALLASWRNKLVIPLPAKLLSALVRWKSSRLTTPGRLYTFVCERL
ncbi:MAG: class I SAM-dependent methyltransferase [Desulfovibrio sp.]|nr:class I SAM-dependent methyltransferase [Desulfovibrio sp.]